MEEKNSFNIVYMYILNINIFYPGNTLQLKVLTKLFGEKNLVLIGPKPCLKVSFNQLFCLDMKLQAVNNNQNHEKFCVEKEK